MNVMLKPEVHAALSNPGNAVIKPGVERMRAALGLFSNPQNKYPTIHITGSNGKGSTAAFIEAGLVHAGLRVGKFTSPHIWRINECITLNGEPISDAELERIFFIVDKVLKSHNRDCHASNPSSRTHTSVGSGIHSLKFLDSKLELSPFELLTLIMFYFMAEQQVDYLILEAGMGGQNDATNVVDSKFSIITNVSLDHTQWLGNSLQEIATHKAGIIKSGTTIIADNSIELRNAVLQQTSNYVNTLEKYQPDITLDKVNFVTQLRFCHPGVGRDPEVLKRTWIPNQVEKHRVNHGGYNKQYTLSLFGKFQAYNFLCAYEVFLELGLPDASIEYAATHTKWPGRLQVIARDPRTILDATHNLGGAVQLYEALHGIQNPADVVIVTAILKDKDIAAMMKCFGQLAQNVIFTTIKDNPRSLTAAELAQYGVGIFAHRYTADDANAALQLARQLDKKMIIVTGSIYLLQNL